jgi:hypothetical protein
VLAGLLAAPLGGLPLFVHVPVWIIGILMLTSRASMGPATRFAGDDGARIGRVV